MTDYLFSVGGFSALAMFALVWRSVRPRASAPRTGLVALEFTSAVAHEYVGLVYYWLRGWERFSS